MSAWLYEKRELKYTPSVRDGIDLESELKFRREGARLILDVGSDLNLRYDTVATGCVYFHRFFMYHSFKEFNRFVTAIGCLFLAGKVEETPKKCKDLLRVAKPRLTDTQFAAFGDDPKEEVMAIERVLLQTIKFDLQIDHPYQFLIKYAKILLGNKTGIENLVQMAWTFINDSLCTTISLQWEPEIVAISLMYLASRLSKCPINDWKNRKNVEGEKWWDQFVEDLGLEMLEDICHEVLDLYSASGAAAKPGMQQHGLVGGPKSSTTVISQNGTGGSSGPPSGQPSPAISTSVIAPGTAVVPALNTVNNASGAISAPQQQSPAPMLVRRDSTKLPPTASVRGPPISGALPQTSTQAPFPAIISPQQVSQTAPQTPSQRYPPPAHVFPHTLSRRSFSDNITLVDATGSHQSRNRYRGGSSNGVLSQPQRASLPFSNSFSPYPPQHPRGAVSANQMQNYGRLNFNSFNNNSHTNTPPNNQYGRTYGRTYDN